MIRIILLCSLTAFLFTSRIYSQENQILNGASQSLIEIPDELGDLQRAEFAIRAWLANSDINIFSIAGTAVALNQLLDQAQPIAVLADDHTLQVRTTHIFDSVRPFTSTVTTFGTELGEGKFRLPIPVGSWVSYYSGTLQKRFLIKYWGAKNWIVETKENRQIWLQRDHQKPELVGFCPDENTTEEGSLESQLLRLPLNHVRHALSISCFGDLYPALAALPKSLPIAMTASGMKSDQIQLIEPLHLLALQAEVDYSAVQSLEALSSLEMLSMRVSGLRGDVRISLPKLKELKHLALYNYVDRVVWDEALAQYPNLVSLLAIDYQTRPSKKGAPLTTFEKNPELQVFVSTTSHIPLLSHKALSTAPNLTHLILHQGGMLEDDDEGAYIGLRELKYLRCVELTDWFLPEDFFDYWFESENLRGLSDFSSFYVPDFAHCPSLEAIKVKQSQRETKFVNYRKFATAPASLYSIHLYHSSRKDFASLDYPHPKNLKNLLLYDCAIDDAEALYRFSNLERIDISRNAGKIEVLDLSHFANLEYFSLDEWSDLEKIESITGLQYIRRVNVESCRYLESFGTASTNTSILSLKLKDNPALETLDSFRGMERCWQLRVENCDRVETYEVLDENNEIGYLTIANCALMQYARRTP